MAGYIILGVACLSIGAILGIMLMAVFNVSSKSEDTFDYEKYEHLKTLCNSKEDDNLS